ncbi:hypothetical protein V8E54_007006 [Elaphomyces granulatus]
MPFADRIGRSMSSVTSPPLIQFFGIVDTSKLTLAENPGIGLDNTTRNCSAIFLTWSKFPNLENGAYIRGIYMHGFCHKVNEGGRPNNLEFVPFVEIMEVDWASDAKSIQDVPATPVKKEVKPEAASTGGNEKLAKADQTTERSDNLDELGDQDDGTDEPSHSKKAKLGRGKGTPTKHG